MLDESVKIHDKYQFEVKFTYPFDTKTPSTEYHVETYMFLPNNLGVNSSSYSKDEFYNDVMRYTRFKTPVMTLGEITEGESSPLFRLEQEMRRLVSEKGAPAAETAYFDGLRMFCSILKSALRDEEAFIEKSKNDPALSDLIEKYTANSSKALEKFRKLKTVIMSPHVPEKCLKLFQLADEFAETLSNKHYYKLMIFMNGMKGDCKQLRKKLADMIEDNLKYSAANALPPPPKEDSDNEEFVYREGILKKIMASVLFLRQRAVREGAFLEQISFGVAAGLSMAFATGVAFFFRCRFDEFSMSFFLALVVSYMFKDRIKELTRIYMQGALRKHIFDRRSDLYDCFDQKVGHCKENFTFLQDSSAPPDIKSVRNKEHITELEHGLLGENVLCHAKRIKLFSKNCRRIFSDFKADGVVDIMRLNVRAFLEKMDNPVKDLFVLDGGDVKKVKGRREYHLNMVIKYGMPGREDVYKRFLIILSRNGIKKIEELSEIVRLHA
jgi:hypothetical protein